MSDKWHKKFISPNRIYAVLIGIGIAISPIHNRWLTELVTQEGEVGFFLPAFGTALWLMASLAFVVYNWKELDWGNKRVYIPLAVIVVAIGLSGISADGWINKLAPLFMGISLFALYLVARKLGKSIFLPLAIGAGLAILGVFVSGLIKPGVITGGLLFENNYDIVVGYILLGVALFVHRYQWIFASLALLSMFICGAPEGVFVIVVLTLVILFRRDWSKRLIWAVIPIFVVGVIFFSIGYGQDLYGYTAKIMRSEPMTELAGETADSYRWLRIKEALTDIKPLGEGYNLTAYTPYTVHNVPLVIVQQLGWGGILAGIAWLWLSIYCLVKTRWKYVWVLILALSVWDHFIFTQLAPVWWAVIGVSTIGGIENDFIFKPKPVDDNARAQQKYNRMLKVANNSGAGLF